MVIVGAGRTPGDAEDFETVGLDELFGLWRGEGGIPPAEVDADEIGIDGSDDGGDFDGGGCEAGGEGGELDVGGVDVGLQGVKGTGGERRRW